MRTFKYKLGEKVMANIASPRNAESFGRLLLFKVIARLSKETVNGIELDYHVRPVDVRDGTIYDMIQVEEESLRSVEEYNATLKTKE